MADAARDQRETTLAHQGGVEEPGADAGGSAAYRGKDFDELKAKLEAADAEVKRLNQVNFELLRARHDAVLAELSQNECAKQALRDFQEVAGEEDKIRLDRSLREGALTKFAVKERGRSERLAQSQNASTRSARGGVDAGGPGPGHYIAIAELKVALGKLEVKLEAAQKEIARLNKALQDELRAQRDSAVAELAQKKRRRVDDAAAANQ